MKKNCTRRLTEQNGGASFYGLSHRHGTAFAVAYLTYDCSKECNDVIKSSLVGRYYKVHSLMDACYWANRLSHR